MKELLKEDFDANSVIYSLNMFQLESEISTEIRPWDIQLLELLSDTYQGSEGLKLATQVAILNANYIAHRLKNHFPILYKGSKGNVAHECIIDIRTIKRCLLYTSPSPRDS